MTLTEFLLARLDEQHDHAQSLGPGHLGDPWMVRDQEAKRRIITEHPNYWAGTGFASDECETCVKDAYLDYGEITIDRYEWPCPTLRAIASVYADHPDYRDEWKP